MRSARPLLIALIVMLVAPAAFAWASGDEPEDPKPLEAAEARRDEIRKLQAEIERLETLAAEATGDDRIALTRRLSRRKLHTLATFDRLVDNIVEIEESGREVPELRAYAEQGVASLPGRIREHVARALEAVRELEGRRDDVSTEEMPQFETEVAVRTRQVDELLKGISKHFEAAGKLGVDVSDDRAWLRDVAQDRAERLAARIDLLLDRRDVTRDRLATSPTDAAIQQEMRIVDRRVETAVASERTTVDVLEKAGGEVGSYRELLATASDGITTEVLDASVLASLVRRWVDHGKEWLVENGPSMIVRAVAAIVILGFFWLLSRVVRKLVHKTLNRERFHLSELMKRVASNLAGRAVLLLGALVALSQMGISLGPLLAGLGIAGFVLGFALQDSLSNFAAGAMILMYRPYDVGDMVDLCGKYGKVDSMTFVTTTILTIDNEKIIIPNSKIWGDVIKNVTAQEIRRVDMTFGISYGDDIEKAEKVFRSILDDDDRILDDPEPVIKLHELADSSVNFVVRPWVKTSDYWDVFWDTTREVKLRLDREGISIPFPQRDVHFYPAEKDAE